MAKIDPHHSSSLQVHHVVGQVAITYAQDVVADGQGGVGIGKVGAESEEGLW